MRASSSSGVRRVSVASVALAVVPAIMLLVLMTRPVWDVDVFWQLKLGELTLLRHAPVLREPFAALHLGEPLPRVGWLAQAIMAAARLSGGWTALRLLDALCWAGGFWAIAWACRRRGARAEAVLFALLLSFVLAVATASIRPQSYAALSFGLLLALLRLDFPPRRAVPLGALLLVVWQNLHPSVSIGLAALAIHAGAGLLDRFRGQRDTWPWTPMLLAICSIPAMLLTPDGLSIFAISAENARSSLAIHAAEWLPLWSPENLHHLLRIGFVMGVGGILWGGIALQSRLQNG
ncbi:hypothetical protein [Novosphingobium sp. 9]|uniref:hypothetical protein n=1 Tax=Novosphingobium sp. 9 TaxID=2025349 RepID=UPI0021B4F3A2|nr:hypothetical protein [Novosphingobium sp. 9]